MDIEVLRRKVEDRLHSAIDFSAIDFRENVARDVGAVLGEHRKLRFVRASALRKIARCGKSVEYCRLC